MSQGRMRYRHRRTTVFLSTLFAPAKCAPLRRNVLSADFRKQVSEHQPKLAVETGLMALDGGVEMFA